MFNKTTFQIFRLTSTTGNKKNYQNIGLKISGNLEPVDIEFATLAGSAFGKTFKLFSKNIASSVAETDRLKVGTDEYEVRGVQKYKHPPRHLELVLEKVIKQ